MTLSVSIVSHGQGALAAALHADLERLCTGPLEIIVTLNIPEPGGWQPARGRFPVTVIVNAAPKGYGANHNAAFARAGGGHFCVLNPDLRLTADPFPALLQCAADEQVGVCAPLIVDASGQPEDSARPFPTPLAIIGKSLGIGGAGRYPVKKGRHNPDWVAGMFMMLRAPVFRELGGFDERYFLYYEDVDLCARLRLAGYQVALCTAVSALHHAQRASHGNLRYLLLHLASMRRFFMSRPFREVMRRRKSAPSQKRPT